jgi:hypothetical protein
MRKKNYEWFVETDPATNESLAAYLASESVVAESESQEWIGGKLRHGWKVPHRSITLLTKAEKVFSFKFRVFVRKGRGKWRESFLHKKRKVSVHSKKALERLKEIGARKKQA